MADPQDRLQDRLQAAADEMVAAGTETGLQIAVRRHGRVVADVTAGLADSERGVPVDAGTLFFAASAVKGVATSLAHVLAERGDLDYDLRVADVWPEFATPGTAGRNGKERTTLRHVLMHTAGLPGLPPETTPADLCDWDRMCAALAAAEPWWEPGTRFGYHALTFGFLLGETMRRATGQPVSALLRDHLTGPLGVADEVCFAIPPESLPRVARQQPSPGPPEPPEKGSPLDRAAPPALRDTAGLGRDPGVLTADIVSLGTMTARGAALMYSALLGHAGNTRLVSSSRLEEMAAVAFTGMDEVMGFPSRWAFGYSPDRPGGVASRDGSTFGMVGSNGSAAYADIDHGLAVAVMRNGPPAGLDTAARIDQLLAEQEHEHEEEHR
jgi:CubicO group peptidase (beta-lactamase class C family)